MGRPPGSKNKPKTDELEAHVDDIVERYGGALTALGNEPASIESYTLGPVGVRVVIHFRAAMSAPTDDTQEMDWPAGWPVPQLNDVITVMKGRGGRVRWLEYDLGERIIHIYVV